FEPGAHVHAAGDSAWIAGAWLTEVTGPDGRPFTRPGRGTFVLERRGGKWLAVHSHFSLLPSQSESAPRRLPGARSRAFPLAVAAPRRAGPQPRDGLRRTLHQVWRSPTAAASASSSARHDAGGTIGRTTNFEKPTAMKRSMV